MMLVSVIGRTGFWRKTSSQSSSDRPFLSDGCRSVGLLRLDSEIRNEDRCRLTDGWVDERDVRLFLSDGAAGWKWGRGEICFFFGIFCRMPSSQL